jgi:hypothetical protein
MPEWKSFGRLALALALLAPTACSHGNNDDNGSRPRSNIDLTVTNFAVVPGASDTEDPLTLTGTIQNLGTETANPLPGDSFKVYFNLSQDGTIELNEQGFLQEEVTAPIPPGGSLPFSYTSPFGNGDTLSVFGNFCSSLGCVPPETGVIGVKVDGEDVILELDEGNNFGFVTHEVVGTRVAAAMSTCDFGSQLGSSGCNLIVGDEHTSVTFHRPCVNCQATEVVLPNELHRFITVTLQIRGCTNTSCGWGVIITSETQKPGLPVSKLQASRSCTAFSVNGPDATCSYSVEIRDENY